MAKVLCTGGAGFIGSHLVDKCVQMGHETFVIDDLSAGLVYKRPEAKFYKLDLRNISTADALIKTITPHVVFHLAANAAENKAQFSPIDITSRNWNTFINTLVPAINGGNLKRVVVTSSIAVYGDGQAPFTEITKPEPEDLYGWSKLMMEKALEILSPLHNFEYVITRPHNVYGPRQNMADPFRNVVTIFMNQILKKEPITIYGDGEQRRCFSYIYDVVDAIYRCGFVENPEPIYNIGSDRDYSVNELANLILKVSGGASKVKHLRDRPNEVKIATSTHDLAKRDLNYEDSISLEAGLRETWEYCRREGPQETNLTGIEIYSDKLPENWK